MSEPAFHAGRFAALMQKGKFTDGKLAYASGVSRTMIYYLRKGEREKVSAENLAALAAALKTSPQYLLGVTEDASPEYKTMPPIVASIADLATQLPQSRQRELQELGRTLLAIEDRADVEAIYGELMEKITRLAELEGGDAMLNRLLEHIEMSTRGALPRPMARERRRGHRHDENADMADNPAQRAE